MFETIAAYDVRESLGRGTFGTVYLAKRKTDGHVACVKKLGFCPGKPSVGESSFEREVKAVSSVQHQNVVKVLGWGREGACYGEEDGYRPWILLEYCSQGSLKGFIDRAKQAGAARLGVEEEQVVRWVKDVLSALKELHSRSIIHRDLKPANVVVHASGVAKVCDFGVAASSECTHNTHAGTTHYMAPQIVCGTRDGYKEDADMFSVGVMVLEMFTLSRIPDAQRWDTNSDISKLLYIWYAGDRVSARQNEDALHIDVSATLGRCVSRRWSEAVSKLVVGCLYFSRDVRLTSSEAGALLGPCSGEASTGAISVGDDRTTAGTTTKMTFAPVPLADEYRCPVCMEDLYPAMAYQCLHKVCEACAPRCADCPKCKATGPPPRRDHDFSNLVEHQRSIFGFVCDTCFTSVSPEERSWHTCADALADRVFAMAASAGVARADLRVDAQTVIRAKQARPEMGKIEMDGMLTDLFLRRSDRADAAALVLIDFDQVGTRDAAHVPDLLTNLIDKLVRDRLASRPRVTLEAYGLCFSNKYNPVLIRNLTRLGVEMKTVSSAKKEETDRHIERAARATEAPVVVIVSSDQDFVATAKELGQSGKKAVLVHDARAGSSHEKLMGFYSDAWRCDELVPRWGSLKYYDAESLFASEETISIDGEEVPVTDLVRNKMFDEMQKSGREVASWCTYAKCKKGLECTYAHRTPEAAAGAQASSSAQTRTQPSRLTFKIQGKEVPTSELVKNGLFEVMKANPDHKAQWCPQREACKKGSECRLGHLKNEAQPASATLKIDGEDVPVSDLVRNKMFDERNNGRTEFKWCNRRDCQEGLECTFAHRKTEAVARAQASELTFKIQGKQVLASELVKNQAYLILKKDPTAKLIWCAHAQRCKKGLECTYAHRKPEAAAGAQTSSSTQARAQASELTFKILGKPVLASELVKNAAYLKMKNNADHKVIWCRHRDACEEGLECTYAHRKSEAAAGAQASPQTAESTFKIQGKEVPTSELVKNGLFEVMKANPDHKAQWCPQQRGSGTCKKGLACKLAHLKKDPSANAAGATLKIDGEDVPVSDLVRNKMFDERDNGRTEFQWCNRRDCQEGLECTFAHRKTEAVARAQASELTFKIQGKQVPASELVKNQAYLKMKNNAEHNVIWCKDRDACEEGLECTYAHRKPEAAAGAQASSSTQDRAHAAELTLKTEGKEVSVSQLVPGGGPRKYLAPQASGAQASSWRNPANAAGLSLKIDGEDVSESSLVRNNFDIQNGPARAQASELIFKIQGKQVLACTLVKNVAYLAMKKKADHKVVWCRHRDACEEGLECTYAHRKPEAAAGARASSSAQNRPQPAELTFKILGKQVLASELVKNAAYLAMKNNADHKVIWCKDGDACEEGLECMFAHSKTEAVAGAQTSETTFNIQGERIPASELVKNKAYLNMKSKPAHRVLWCKHRDACLDGLECTFAHRKSRAAR